MKTPSKSKAELEQEAIDRLFSSLNHIGYSAVTGPIDKPCQCQSCSKEWNTGLNISEGDLAKL